MGKIDPMFVCETCKKRYEFFHLYQASLNELRQLEEKREKRRKDFSALGNEALATNHSEDERIEKLNDFIYHKWLAKYCSVQCMDEGRAMENLRKEKEQAKAAEIAKNRHNPLYAIKTDLFAFLMGILLWGVPMFLLWRGFMPLPLVALAAVFLSYLSRWSSLYKFLDKFALAEPMSNFMWIFAFVYALRGAVEVICGIFYGIPHAVGNAAELLGRGSSYLLMALVALALTVAHSLLKKSALKDISVTIAWCLTLVALFAIPIFSLFHLASYWIGFPVSAIIAVVGGVLVYKRFGHWGIAAAFFADLVLSETLFA